MRYPADSKSISLIAKNHLALRSLKNNKNRASPLFGEVSFNSLGSRSIIPLGRAKNCLSTCTNGILPRDWR